MGDRDFWSGYTFFTIFFGGFMKFVNSILFSSILIFSFTACQSSQYSNQNKAALTGGVAGAGLGAIVGSQTGNPGAGIAIGTAIGALSGGLIGRNVDKQNSNLDDQDRRLALQNRQIEENQRIIDELKNRGADVRKTARGVVVNLPDVLFKFDRADLTTDAIRAVREIADVTKQYQERSLAVEGHTDSVGTIIYNQRLSEERAINVARELVSEGVAKRRIAVTGFGESDPISSNQTEHGRSRNRRVEVIIEN